MITRQLYPIAVHRKRLRWPWPARRPSSGAHVSQIRSAPHIGHRLSKTILASLGMDLVV